MSTTTAGYGTIARYAPALRFIHWLTAILILGMFIVGGWIVYFDPGDGPFKETLYTLHESTGVAIWLLVLLRIVVRLTTGAPKLPADVPAVIRAAATANHIALYAVLLLQPIIGFCDSNAWGSPVKWYGLFVLPSPIGKQPDPVAQSLSDLHWWGALALLVLLAAHIGGAAYHGLVRRDGVTRHMM
jgi:cytochrome b561